MATLRSPSSRRAWIEMSPRAVFYTPVAVALLAEGVDRNTFCRCRQNTRRRSPSSRRAWIEIELKKLLVQLTQVALLAEGVDRNPTRSQ